jgi:hypothetical protein
MNKKKYTSLLLTATFVFSVAFVSSIAHAQWVAPTGNPPADNTPAPVNIGLFGQMKSGWLSVMNLFGGEKIAATEIRATRFCIQPNADFGSRLFEWVKDAGPVPALDNTNCVDITNLWGSGGGTGGSSDYTPQGPTSITVGGITAGTNLGISPITLQSLIDRMLYPYAGPNVVLTASPATRVYKKGSSVGVVLTATATPHSNPITNVTILENGSAINSTSTPSLTFGDTITTNTTYQATATDGAGGGGPTTASSNTITYTFVYPMYGGVGAPGLTASQIASLTEFIQVQGDVAVQSSPDSSVSPQVYYFAYPSSYGILQSIRDNSNFETKADYNLRTVTMTSLPGSPTYNVYEFDHATTQTNFTNTFKF